MTINTRQEEFEMMLTLTAENAEFAVTEDMRLVAEDAWRLGLRHGWGLCIEEAMSKPHSKEEAFQVVFKEFSEGTPFAQCAARLWDLAIAAKN